MATSSGVGALIDTPPPPPPPSLGVVADAGKKKCPIRQKWRGFTIFVSRCELLIEWTFSDAMAPTASPTVSQLVSLMVCGGTLGTSPT